MNASELLSSALDGAAKKGRGIKGAVLAVLLAGVGFGSRAQLQHNAEVDRRLGAVEQVTSEVRAQSAATAANVEWLVHAHGGLPKLPAGAGSAAAAAVPLDEPVPIPVRP